MSDRKRVLILGVGSIGERHLRCFQTTGRVDLSLCDTSEELRRRVAEKYGIGRAYADFDTALADRHDAAVIATPAHLHVPMAVRLAEAGVHLLIEKPLSTGLDGIDQLQETLDRRRLVAAVAYVLRGHPALVAMKRAIDSGRFGEPVQLVATGGQHFPTHRPAYREIYYSDRATGGGAIQDGLTHTLNAGEWLVGPIDSLVADAAHQVLEGLEVEDTVGLMARHAGVLASYSLNQHQAPNEWTMTVVCRGGTARCEFHHHRWRWMTEPDGPWHEEDFGPIERDSLFVDQANAFLDCVEGLAPPVCTLEEGLQTLRANLAALASV
ncbi:MAG: Gfo/Idh/MocA family oxidoreductase, partial [Planctomycetota bacterium]